MTDSFQRRRPGPGKPLTAVSSRRWNPVWSVFRCVSMPFDRRSESVHRRGPRPDQARSSRAHRLRLHVVNHAYQHHDNQHEASSRSSNRSGSSGRFAAWCHGRAI